MTTSHDIERQIAQLEQERAAAETAERQRLEREQAAQQKIQQTTNQLADLKRQKAIAELEEAKTAAVATLAANDAAVDKLKAWINDFAKTFAPLNQLLAEVENTYQRHNATLEQAYNAAETLALLDMQSDPVSHNGSGAMQEARKIQGIVGSLTGGMEGASSGYLALAESIASATPGLKPVHQGIAYPFARSQAIEPGPDATRSSLRRQLAADQRRSRNPLL